MPENGRWLIGEQKAGTRSCICPNVVPEIEQVRTGSPFFCSSTATSMAFDNSATLGECLGRPHDGRAVHDFWAEVRQQLDDGRPMPSPRIRRDEA